MYCNRAPYQKYYYNGVGFYIKMYYKTNDSWYNATRIVLFIVIIEYSVYSYVIHSLHLPGCVIIEYLYLQVSNAASSLKMIMFIYIKKDNNNLHI
jgi:hypothetical protein